MSEDNGKPISPAPILDDVHTLDLEFWPNLDIGNEFLHVDWFEDVRKPEGQPGQQQAQLTGSQGSRLDDAIAGLEGIGDGLDAVGVGGGPGLGVGEILEGIDDDLVFLQAQGVGIAGGDCAAARPTTPAGSAPYSAIESLPSKDSGSIKGKGSKKKRQTERQTNRLRWTPELHALFVEAVQHLQGPEKATPKGIMLYMKVDGLTTFHIKSHLQKYRMNCSLAKDAAKLVADGPGDAEGAEGAGNADMQGSKRTQQEAVSSSKKQKTSGATASPTPLTSPAANETDGSHDHRIEQALMVQMQMQKKLQEQLEEQRRLQLSIQAQEQHIRQLKEELQRSNRR